MIVRHPIVVLAGSPTANASAFLPANFTSPANLIEVVARPEAVASTAGGDCSPLVPPVDGRYTRTTFTCCSMVSSW